MSEYTWMDTDGNGTLDSGYADTDADGYWDVAAHDLNGDLVIDAYSYDSDRDGVIGDEVRFDGNQDGLSDAIAYDHDENWVADAVATEQTGWQAVALPAQSVTPEGFTTTTMPMQGAYYSGTTGETPQMTFARLLQTETNPLTQVQLANAIQLGNIIDLHNPWLD